MSILVEKIIITLMLVLIDIKSELETPAISIQTTNCPIHIRWKPFATPEGGEQNPETLLEKLQVMAWLDCY